MARPLRFNKVVIGFLVLSIVCILSENCLSFFLIDDGTLEVVQRKNGGIFVALNCCPALSHED